MSAGARRTTAIPARRYLGTNAQGIGRGVNKHESEPTGVNKHESEPTGEKRMGRMEMIPLQNSGWVSEERHLPADMRLTEGSTFQLFKDRGRKGWNGYTLASSEWREVKASADGSSLERMRRAPVPRNTRSTTSLLVRINRDGRGAGFATGTNKQSLGSSSTGTFRGS
jgi:hypothetical protein